MTNTLNILGGTRTLVELVFIFPLTIRFEKFNGACAAINIISTSNKTLN
jgi:hypothetical protein